MLPSHLIDLTLTRVANSFLGRGGGFVVNSEDSSLNPAKYIFYLKNLYWKRTK